MSRAILVVSSLSTEPAQGLASKVVGGTQYIVSGTYDYHHYMQDHFDDDGYVVRTDPATAPLHPLSLGMRRGQAAT
jgi:hypothetical protein